MLFYIGRNRNYVIPFSYFLEYSTAIDTPDFIDLGKKVFDNFIDSSQKLYLQIPNSKVKLFDYKYNRKGDII